MRGLRVSQDRKRVHTISAARLAPRFAALGYSRPVNLALEISAVTLALIAAVFFGLAISVAQLGLKVVPTLAAAAIANLSGAVLFWAAIPIYWDTAGADTRAVGLFVVIGLFFPASVTLLMLESNRRMGPSITATISATTPLFAYTGAVLFLAEALVGQGLIGTLAIAVGVTVLAWQAPAIIPSYTAWLLLLPAGAALIRAIAQLLTKYGLLLWPNTFVAIVIAYTVSTVIVWSAVWLRGERIPCHRALIYVVGSDCLNAIGCLRCSRLSRAVK